MKSTKQQIINGHLITGLLRLSGLILKIDHQAAGLYPCNRVNYNFVPFSDHCTNLPLSLEIPDIFFKNTGHFKS